MKLIGLFDFFLNISVSKNYVLSLKFGVLEGFKSSGRPVGNISTYFRQKRSGGFRAMTKKPKKLTSIKLTSIKFRAYCFFLKMSFIFYL